MNDNGSMAKKITTFDDIAVHRPELAASYLALLRGQPGRPIALFAPRRIGKTYFLETDLAPAAQKLGMLPVYADLWLHRTSPMLALNHALEEALDDATVPHVTPAKVAKTPVKKLGAFGLSLDFGDEPQRRGLPEAPELRFDALITRLAAASGKVVLLMLDEIQSIGQTVAGESAIATIRAVLQKQKLKVQAVFTGSSQEALGAMMMAAGGPMYQFAQMLVFPVLGDEYLVMLAKHFATVHSGKRLDMAAMKGIFAHIGHKPALMKDIVKEMSAEGSTDFEATMQRFMEDERNVPAWQGVFNRREPLEQAILVLIAHKIAPMSRNSLALLSAQRHLNASLSKVRTALERLRIEGILSKYPNMGYQIEDQLFADYLAKIHSTPMAPVQRT